MKVIRHSIAVIAAIGLFLPAAALAKETNEPSSTPRTSSSPRVSESVQPVQSSAGDVSDEEQELKGLEKDLAEEEDAVVTPEIEVPKELEARARKMVDEDEDVADVHISAEDKSVEVKYRLRAKLFGLIDVPYELQAKVDAKEGTIKAKGPWWLLFARDNAAQAQAALEADPTLVTLTNQGTVLSKIISILKGIASK